MVTICSVKHSKLYSSPFFEACIWKSEKYMLFSEGAVCVHGSQANCALFIPAWMREASLRLVLWMMCVPFLSWTSYPCLWATATEPLYRGSSLWWGCAIGVDFSHAPIPLHMMLLVSVMFALSPVSLHLSLTTGTSPSQTQHCWHFLHSWLLVSFPGHHDSTQGGNMWTWG